MPGIIWKGNITFGLVNISIELHSSEDRSSSISFRQIDKRDNARIKYKRINSTTGEEVPWEYIGKGYEHSKDHIYPVKDNELLKVAGENAKTIAIEEFVDEHYIDILNIERVYFLAPGKKAEKGYVILREALKKTKKIGIAKVIISTKEYLAGLSTKDNALILYILRYHDEIKPLNEIQNIPSEKKEAYKVNTKEIDIATKLIETMSADWNPKKYKDEYKVAVQHWINKMIDNKKPVAMNKRGVKNPVNNINFIELLKQSIKAEKPQKSKIKSKINKKQGYEKRTTH